MKGYIDEGAIHHLFDTGIIRCMSISEQSFKSNVVKYVNIIMRNDNKMGTLTLQVRCGDTGAFEQFRCGNSHYKDTSAEDEVAVKTEVRYLLDRAIQRINEHRIQQGHNEVSFIMPDEGHIDYPSLISDEVKTPKGLMERFMDELIVKEGSTQEDDVIRESDFVPNPDGSRPWENK
jgi:hypothetical protein